MIKFLKNIYFAVKDKQTSHIGNHYVNKVQQNKIPLQLITSPFHALLSCLSQYILLSLAT